MKKRDCLEAIGIAVSGRDAQWVAYVDGLISGNLEMSDRAKQDGDYITAGAMRAINLELEQLKALMMGVPNE